MQYLSWQVHENQLNIVLNHNCVTGNVASKPPVTEYFGNINVLKTDGEKSWIIANEHGIVFCLLDSEESVSISENSKSLVTEDHINELLDADTVKEVRIRLDEVEFHGVNPFQLIVFPGIYTPLQWEWDGIKLVEIVAPPPLITSSSTILDRETKLQKEFRNETNGYIKTLSFEKQLKLHESYQLNGSDSSSLDMVTVHILPDEINISRRLVSPGASDQTEAVGQLSRSSVNPSQQTIKEPDEYEDNLLDIQRMFREKSPELDRKIPAWVMRLVKAIIKEKTLNYYLNTLRPVSCNFFSSTVMNHFGVRGKLKPAAGKLPAPENRLIFMSNHPSGGFDGLLLLAWVSHYYPDVRIVVNDLLWNIPHLRPYLVPVDILGEQRDSREHYYESFREESPLLIFPAGVTARKVKGELVEGRWKETPVRMALEYNRSVVPIHIDAHNSRLFNGIYRARRSIGLNINLEMFLLAREFLKPACKEFSVTVGETIAAEQIKFMGNYNKERAESLRQICQKLPGSSSRSYVEQLQT